MAALTRTSFQKKSRIKIAQIPGTRPSLQNSQLLVSTGVPSLDYLLGGGLAVGTLLLIEEDAFGNYSRVLLKYFLAEGVVSHHGLFVASVDLHPDEIYQSLPAVILEEPLTQGDRSAPQFGMSCTQPQVEPPTSDQTLNTEKEEMRIAWRYQNLPKVHNALSSDTRFGHNYDFSRTMEKERLQTNSCCTFYPPDLLVSSGSSTLDTSPLYQPLLRTIHSCVRDGGYDGSHGQPKNVLRLGLLSLGTGLWGDGVGCSKDPSATAPLTQFLLALRAVLRSSLSVALVTVPAHLFQSAAALRRVRHLSDYVLTLQSFVGSSQDANPLYHDYHGLLHVNKTPRLNSLVPVVPDVQDLAFKLRRKKFTIERLHLPPDLSDAPSRLTKAPSLARSTLAEFSCSSGQSNLDF
uniref:elongator complex protein 4 isoform X2 n=1 Tax=Myxine glutinosa TaxID=7769 RepID=UPI00358F8723